MARLLFWRRCSTPCLWHSPREAEVVDGLPEERQVLIMGGSLEKALMVATYAS